MKSVRVVFFQKWSEYPEFIVFKKKENENIIVAHKNVNVNVNLYVSFDKM